LLLQERLVALLVFSSEKDTEKESSESPRKDCYLVLIIIIPFVLLHVHIYKESGGEERKRSSIMRRDNDFDSKNYFETRVCDDLSKSIKCFENYL